MGSRRNPRAVRVRPQPVKFEEVFGEILIWAFLLAGFFIAFK